MASIAWHNHCVLRDDVRKGTLALAEFAADLYAVRTGEASNVYRLPELFFARTYPTYNLKTLTRDVLQRLAGFGGKPVIRVQVAYGGGKTHALITLLHLSESGASLSANPTVQELIGFSGVNPLPKARVAMLPFDKFDVKTGLNVVGPDGKTATVKTPWGALAYQLAGADGLAKVAAHEANYITPAEPLLVELLKAPQGRGLSTLILIDEAVIYMRGAVNDDPRRLGILKDFFQLLTQAVTKVNRAALVASLISSDVESGDQTGVQVLNAMEGVFARLEETVEPVSQEDVAELLRRRLFESVADETARRGVVDKIVGAMQRLPLRDAQKDKVAYDRLLQSYPFHPDLLDVFYQKWTQLSGFQRTRGVLRVFAVALKALDGKDLLPLVGPGALLGSNSKLSEALRDLVEACEEGNSWTPILNGELQKAHEVQQKYPLLRYREVEQAVVGTFLHSQPQGQKADPTDLYAMLAHPEIDRTSLAQGLEAWRAISWHLNEDTNIWRLTTTPNLTNMHVRAMDRLSEKAIANALMTHIKSARLGQNQDGVSVHMLPDSPNDIADNPELHFVVVGPELAAVAGKPVSEALGAFFKRQYPNTIVVLAPELSRLAGLRARIRKILGWEGIETGDEMRLLNPSQKALLIQRKQEDARGIADSVKAAYCVLITLEEDGEVRARQLPSGNGSPFEGAKGFLSSEERLLTTTLDPDLLTPESYFDLWKPDEAAKPVHALYNMFATFPRLPKLLKRTVFADTLQRGVQEGRIVIRHVRGDGSTRTFWRERLSDEDLALRNLEIVPVRYAELHNLPAELLLPNQLPGLWRDDKTPISVADIKHYFKGDAVPRLTAEAVLFDAIRTAVGSGLLMARLKEAAFLKATLPDAAVRDELELLPPMPAVKGTELSMEALPEAWTDETSSVGQLKRALAQRRGSSIPWRLLVDAVNAALGSGLFSIDPQGEPWPCADEKADGVRLKLLKPTPPSQPPEVRDTSFTRAEAVLTELEIQDLAETIQRLTEVAPELDFQFQLTITAKGERPSDDVLNQLNETLARINPQLRLFPFQIREP